jgi:hypothetical protein
MTEYTVKDLIEWLQTQDQGAIVQVLKREDGRDWQGDIVKTVNFSPDLADYTDLRGNQFVSPNEPHFNRRTLILGEG